MNLDQMKVAITKQQLLGLEPYYILKSILERKQTNGWGRNLNIEFCFWIRFQIDLESVVSGQSFEEITLQFIDCIQPDLNNQLANSPHEQLIGSAKFNLKSKKQNKKLFV